MKITMWLPIKNGQEGAYSHDELWVKEVETGFLPNPGYEDKVSLWASEDDGGDGPHWHIRSRWMQSNGSWHVQLTTMVLNQDEYWNTVIRNRLSTGGPYNREAHWDTNVNGDPRPDLRRGGWITYKEWTNLNEEKM